MFGDVGEFLKLVADLPTGWKITFIFIFFGLPKIIQIFGGGKVVRGSIDQFFKFLTEVIKRYQARKDKEVEGEVLTEAYTRTLVIESLGLFAERLKRVDHKINHILLVLDKEADLEIIEVTSPKRDKSDTVIHNKIREQLEKMRKLNEGKN